MRTAHVLFLSVLLTTTSLAQDQMLFDSLRSPALGVVRRYGVLLPRNHDPQRAYPVLYLLHGHDGSYRDWADRTAIASFVQDIPLIVVLPDADNSWYVDASEDPTKAYERYLVNDLRKVVEGRFRIDSTRRAVAGLSMGGYGALLYGLKHPDLFAFCGSLSGAFSLVSFMEDTVRQPRGAPLNRTLRRAFGPEPNAHRERNDVYALIGSVDTSRAPYVYLVAGIQDGFRGFLPAHRMLADTLRAHGVRYEYHETPGGHSWKYWGREIQPLIARMRDVLAF